MRVITGCAVDSRAMLNVRLQTGVDSQANRPGVHFAAMSICHFVSDLHLFSRRSSADRHLEAIKRAAAESDTFVLAGDNFDFHWAAGRPVEESAEVAAEWLASLAGSAPGCRFHVLLGNHDHQPALIARLEVLRNELPNFAWDAWFVRLGSGVFLHGDAANFRMNAERLRRFRDHCAAKLPHNPGLEPLYEAVIRARLHVLCARAIYPHRVVARRLRRYLDEIGHGPASGVRDVYFGHTHRVLDGYEHRGLRFHNCGAPIAGLRFRIVRARID